MFYTCWPRLLRCLRWVACPSLHMPSPHPWEGHPSPQHHLNSRSVGALVIMTGDRARVLCGVRAFRKSSAKQLVVTDPEYWALALGMGLRDDQLAQAAALAVSTTMINEYLGIGRRWLSSRW